MGSPKTNAEVLTLRPAVAAFAQAMEAELRENEHKGGRVAWRQDAPIDLLRRVREETEELDLEIFHTCETRGVLNLGKVLSEAADVANMAMMVADACGALDVPEDVPATPAVATEPATLQASDDGLWVHLRAGGKQALINLASPRPEGIVGDVVEATWKRLRGEVPRG